MVVAVLRLGDLQQGVAAVHSSNLHVSIFFQKLPKESFAAPDVKNVDFVLLLLVDIESIDDIHTDFRWESGLKVLLLVVGRHSVEFLLEGKLRELFKLVLKDVLWLSDSEVSIELVLRHFPAES